jgi:hypothetical protein
MKKKTVVDDERNCTLILLWESIGIEGCDQLDSQQEQQPYN